MKRIAIVLAMAIATSAGAHGNEPHQGGIKTSATRLYWLSLILCTLKSLPKGMLPPSIWQFPARQVKVSLQ